MFIMPFCLRLLPRQLRHRQRKYHQTAAAAQPFPSTIPIFHDFFSSRPFILNTTHDSARFSIFYFLLYIKTRPVSREYLQKCKRKPCRARTYARNSALSPGSQRQAQAAGLCASLGLRLAFACGECPTGAPLAFGPSTIVSAIGSGPLHERKDTHKGCLSFMGLVGLEPMTSTMSKKVKDSQTLL